MEEMHVFTKGILLALLLAIVSGCGGGYQGPGLHEPIDPRGFFEEPPEGFDYGLPPTARVIEQTVRQHFEYRLKDAASAEFKFGLPQRSYKAETALTQIASYTPQALQFTMFAIKNGDDVSGKIDWIGWSVPIAINAENSLGGYTGYQGYVVMFDGTQIVNHMTMETWQDHVDKGVIKELGG